MTETAVGNLSLQEIVCKHKKGQVSIERGKDALGHVPRILAELYDPYANPEKRKISQEALKDRIDTYFHSRLGAHYDSIHSSMFRLTREIEINKNKVTVPVFAGVLVGQATWKGSYETYINYNRQRVEISVAAPNVPEDVVKDIVRARIRYNDILNGMLKNPVVGQMIGLGRIPLPETDYKICWKPRNQDYRIKVVDLPDPDPLLIMHYHGLMHDGYFLVSNWDVPEEDSYEKYLREFGERISNVAQGKKEPEIPF